MIMQKFFKIFVLLLLVFSFLDKGISFAYSSLDVVDISLKLSLCGDGLVQGSEDCEQGSAITKTCLDYGYQKGVLTCDYSCSYNYSDCKYIPKVEDVVQPEIENPTEVSNPTNLIPPREIYNNLPLLLRLFDFNRDGSIDFTEFTNMLYSWVEKWSLFRQVEDKEDVKGACDVNADSECNVIDFSIILYYVNND
jgi:hypothetical protein